MSNPRSTPETCSAATDDRPSTCSTKKHGHHCIFHTRWGLVSHLHFEVARDAGFDDPVFGDLALASSVVREYRFTPSMVDEFFRRLGLAGLNRPIQDLSSQCWCIDVGWYSHGLGVFRRTSSFVSKGIWRNDSHVSVGCQGLHRLRSRFCAVAYCRYVGNRSRRGPLLAGSAWLG